MRKALILLAAVALLILAVGALNNGTAFNIDYVAGTASSVSLMWVSVVLAALVFVVGVAAAWFAQSAMTGARRKLEAELQSTYERLREAEALAARPAPPAEPVGQAHTPEVVSATVVAAREAATVVETEPATVVIAEPETVVSDEAAGSASGETATVVESGEAETVVESGEAETVVTDPEEAPSEPVAEPAAGEQTAITLAGGPPPDESPAQPEAGESVEAGPADDAGRPEQSSS